MSGSTDWRDGWEPFDPLRPCYTCGAPPAFWYDRDRNEPGYRCGPHEGPIMHDWRYTDGRWSGKTTDDDYQRAYEHARKMLEDNDREGRQTKFLLRNETRMQTRVRSVLAEMFVARVTGLPWRPELMRKGYRRTKKKPDVGRNIEVRNARDHEGRLMLYDNDPGDRVAVLVTGVNPFVCRGWIRVRNGKLRKLYRTRPEPARWHVPQELLLPMDALPDDV